MTRDETLNELEKLVKFAKKHGLKTLDVGAYSFEFSDKPMPKRTRTPKEDKPIEAQAPEFSEDDVLNWSAE